MLPELRKGKSLAHVTVGEPLMTTQTQPTCVLVRPDQAEGTKQSLQRFAGISAENAGAQHLCLHLIVIPPGGRAKAHLHEGHESAVYVLNGQGGMWYGEQLEHHMEANPGDFIYIPANLPHLPYNRSQTESCTAVIARTDPNEQESVLLRPDLDGVH
jgi:uncharacterized RmlC-like cupin family protein